MKKEMKNSFFQLLISVSLLCFFKKIDRLQSDMVGYALVRKIDQIDNSSTTKFAFIFWLGDQIKGLQKARISVHRGQITDFIGVRSESIVVCWKQRNLPPVCAIFSPTTAISCRFHRLLERRNQRRSCAL
jgi:hypothetical protein